MADRLSKNVGNQWLLSFLVPQTTFFFYPESVAYQNAFDAYCNTGNYGEFILINMYGMLKQESMVMNT